MRQRARGLAHRGAGVLILALNSGSPTTVAGVNFPPPNLRPYPLSASPAASYSARAKRGCVGNEPRRAPENPGRTNAVRDRESPGSRVAMSNAMVPGARGGR